MFLVILLLQFSLYLSYIYFSFDLMNKKNEKFNEISKTKIDLFEKLIFDIKQNKIRIKFIISPYHPIVYKEIYNNIDYKNVLKTEKYITEFSIKNNIKKVGSFDPKRNNFDNSYFYDGMHCNEKGIIQLLSNLK